MTREENPKLYSTKDMRIAVCPPETAQKYVLMDSWNLLEEFGRIQEQRYFPWKIIKFSSRQMNMIVIMLHGELVLKLLEVDVFSR